MKLYKTLPLSKLATFMRPALVPPDSMNDAEKEQLNKLNFRGPSMLSSDSMHDPEKELIKQLLCFKHKMKNMVWNKGASGLDGSFQSGSEVRTQL